MRQISRTGLYLLIVLLSPIIVLAAAGILAIIDVAFFFFGRRKTYTLTAVNPSAASIVIPTWNGRDLLAKFLPAVTNATSGNPAHEIIVVDNASEDGTADFLRDNFPRIR